MRFAICNCALLLLVITGCTSQRTTPGMKSPDSSTQRPTTQPILYHRTGGIAGTDDRVVIWDDGFVQVHGKLMGHADVQLPSSRLEKLREIFDHSTSASPTIWSLQTNVTFPGPDAYRITLYSAGQSATLHDVIAAVTESATRFVAAYTEIEAIAADAVNAAANLPTAP